MNALTAQITNYLPSLINGLLITITSWGSSALLSLTIGTLFGILRYQQLRIEPLASAIDLLTLILRAIPFYVQLLMAYFVIPSILAINPPPIVVAIITLGFCSAAYTSQIVLGGLNTIARGQWDAAFALGYSTYQTLSYVIIPQVFWSVISAVCAELEQLLKSTAIFSSIGIMELTGVTRNIISRDLNPMIMYSVAAAAYVGLSVLLYLAKRAFKKEQFI